jgi:hypothetical protein
VDVEAFLELKGLKPMDYMRDELVGSIGKVSLMFLVV